MVICFAWKEKLSDVGLYIDSKGIPVVPVCGRQQKFKVILGYAVNLGSAWSS